MKILHVISNISPRYGGPAKVCRELTARLRSAGVEVDIFTTNMDFPSGILSEFYRQKIDDSDNGETRFFPVEFSPMVFSLSMLFSLIRDIRKYDLVHIHGLYRFPQTFSALCARFFNVPYIIRPHGSLSPVLFYQKRNIRLKRFYEWLFDLPNLRKADGIHFTTAEEMELAEFLDLGNKGFVLPNGIDFESFQVILKDESVELKQDKFPKVLFFGRITSKKGLDLLIPAFAKVLEKFPGAILELVGPENDDYGQVVRKMARTYNIADQVIFSGMLETQEDIIRKLKSSDLFVLPSYDENFGVAVVEAMSCALPVVISDKVNIYREVAEARAGIIVPCEVDRVAEAVCKLLDDPLNGKKMGENGKRLVQKKYDWTGIIPDLLNIYHAILSDGNTDRMRND